MIDLHTHTTASDGTYTPKDLIDYALEKNLHALAITDHDTIDGLLEARKYYNDLRDQSMELINGIELSTNLPEYDFDIHIVGLYMNTESSVFKKDLDFINKDRDARNVELTKKINDAGYPLNLNDIKAFSGNSVITRSHFANYMVKLGYFDTVNDVFNQLIGNGKPAFIPRKNIPTEFGIRMINNSGGVSILAHPTLYGLDNAGIEILIGKLKEAGLMGMETYYSLYSDEQSVQMLKFAQQFNLIQSGGSDFHGDNKPGNDLGVGFGKLSVPNLLLDTIKKA